LEGSKANAGRIAVNELLNDPQLPKDHTPQRAESSNYLSLSFGWLFEIPFGFVELLEQRLAALIKNYLGEIPLKFPRDEAQLKIHIWSTVLKT
jgi:hypothetical protein